MIVWEEKKTPCVGLNAKAGLYLWKPACLSGHQKKRRGLSKVRNLKPPKESFAVGFNHWHSIDGKLTTDKHE